MNAKDTISLIREKLNKYEEHAIRGMKVGASAYHQGKISLITDLRDYLNRIDRDIDSEELILVPTTRPTCKDRFYSILGQVSTAKDGYNPFQNRGRGKEQVCWRQCIWRLLIREGYQTVGIARATGYDHATIWWGVKRLDGYIEAGDYLAVATWNDLMAAIR